jgi:hypothetical protein
MAVDAVSAADLAYIQAHPSAVVVAQKPLLKVAKQNHKNGLPVCTAAPAVTGTATVGQVQTCSSGTWLNTPTYAYQWRRKGANIPSATAATYTLAAVDHGYQVECEVTATNGSGSAATKSNAVTVP